MQLPDFHTPRDDNFTPEQRFLIWARTELPPKVKFEVFAAIGAIYLEDGLDRFSARDLQHLVDVALMDTED